MIFLAVIFSLNITALISSTKTGAVASITEVRERDNSTTAMLYEKLKNTEPTMVTASIEGTSLTLIRSPDLSVKSM